VIGLTISLSVNSAEPVRRRYFGETGQHKGLVRIGLPLADCRRSLGDAAAKARHTTAVAGFCCLPRRRSMARPIHADPDQLHEEQIEGFVGLDARFLSVNRRFTRKPTLRPICLPCSAASKEITKHRSRPNWRRARAECSISFSTFRPRTTFRRQSPTVLWSKRKKAGRLRPSRLLPCGDGTLGASPGAIRAGVCQGLHERDVAGRARPDPGHRRPRERTAGALPGSIFPFEPHSRARCD
jgi:hypothetical protein